MPRYNCPFVVTYIHLDFLNVTVFRLNNPEAYGQYHTLKLLFYHKNDALLFSSREYKEPGPVFAPNMGLEEHYVEKIVDSQKRGHRWQYLVQF